MPCYYPRRPPSDRRHLRRVARTGLIAAVLSQPGLGLLDENGGTIAIGLDPPSVAPGETPWIFPSSGSDEPPEHRGPAGTPRQRMEGFCGNRALEPSDFAYFWLGFRWAGFESRSDLGLLRASNVRALQLHRCTVEISNLKPFLDRAWTEGLSVVPEIPTRILRDVNDTSCFAGAYDCYDASRGNWRRLLSAGLAEDFGVRRYHPVVEMVLVAIEPDGQVLAPASDCPPAGPLRGAVRAVVAAWDGMLDAEAELAVQVQPGISEFGIRSPVKFATLFATAAVPGTYPESSFKLVTVSEQGWGDGGPPDVCYRRRVHDSGCAQDHTFRSLLIAARGELPAGPRHDLGQYHDVAYRPHHDLGHLLSTRWVHTFAADTPAADVVRTLREYDEFLPSAVEVPTAAALLELHIV